MPSQNELGLSLPSENARLSDLNQERLLQHVLLTASEPYKTFNLNTSQATTSPIAQGYKGGVFQIIAVTNNDLSSFIDVRFNRSQISPIRMFLGDRVITPFNEIFIENPAQPGIVITCAVASEAGNLFTFDKNLQGNLGTISTITHQPGLNELPAGATEVSARIAFGSTAGAAINLMYTVTAGKTLYISRASCGHEASHGADFHITNAADVRQFSILTSFYDLGMIQNFLPQIVVPSGFKVKYRRHSSTDVDTTSGDFVASFSGWEL